MNATVVLTNGAWHGAWAWTPVVPYLVAAGLTPVAVELEGLGGLRGADPSSRTARPFDPQRFATEPSPVAGTTLDSAVDTLLADLRALERGPVTVVAHSLGGTVVTAAAQRAPDLFAGVVFVSAMTPVADLDASGYNTEPEMVDSLLPGLLAADPGVVGAIRLDVGSDEGRGRARAALYADVPAPVADRALSMLCSDAAVGVDGRVAATADGVGGIDRTWVLCAQDRVLTPRLQRRLVRELDEVAVRPTTVVELDCSHSPFLSRPRALARVISGAARTNG